MIFAALLGRGQMHVITTQHFEKLMKSLDDGRLASLFDLNVDKSDYWLLDVGAGDGQVTQKFRFMHGIFAAFLMLLTNMIYLGFSTRNLISQTKKKKIYQIYEWRLLRFVPMKNLPLHKRIHAARIYEKKVHLF